MKRGNSKESNVQNVSYFMLFSSCSDQRREFRKLVHFKIFQISRNMMPKDGSHIGYMNVVP